MQARKNHLIWLLILLYIPSSLQVLVIESLHIVDHLARNMEDFFLHASDQHHHHDHHHHHFDVHHDHQDSDNHFIDYTKKKIEYFNPYTKALSKLQVLQQRTFGYISFITTLVEQPPIPPPKA
jgi:hypothetical protein